MSLDLYCYSFNTKRADKIWETFPEDIMVLRNKYHDTATNIRLNKTQQILHDGIEMEYLIHEDAFAEERLIGELKDVDVFHGSIRGGHFEDNRVAVAIIESLLSKTFHLKSDDGIPLGSEWVRLYQKMDKNTLAKLSQTIAKEYECDEAEATEYALEFFTSMRPIVKDLKENPDSIFVMSFGGDDRCYPKSADKIIEKRAKEHMKKCKGVLPPVL